MTKTLSHKDAYVAMFAFLEEHYKRTGSDDIGSLLSGLCLMQDSMPMDQAYWNDWEKAVESATNGEVRKSR